MEIDHIIPQSHIKNPTKLADVLKQHGLPSEFDITSLDNLVPACRSCNALKLAKPIALGMAAILIADAQSKRAAIQKETENLKKKTRIEKGRAIVSAAYEEGNLSDKDILEILDKKSYVNKKFPLSNFIQLLDEDPIGEISMAHYEAYLDMKIPTLKEGLRLVNEGGEYGKFLNDFEERLSRFDTKTDEGILAWSELMQKWSEEHDKVPVGEIQVYTLRQYADAITRGCFPLANSEMKMSAWHFERPLDILHYLSTAKIASESYFEKPRVGLADIEFMPATLLNYTNDFGDAEWRASLEGKTIKEITTEGMMNVTSSSSHYLSLEEPLQDGLEGDFAYFSEILRADIDGDGLEDILIYAGGGPLTGTHRTSSVVYLSRESRTTPYTIPRQGGWRDSWKPSRH
jgi:HNH endonuclease